LRRRLHKRARLCCLRAVRTGHLEQRGRADVLAMCGRALLFALRAGGRVPHVSGRISMR
jgi:hypothetical protein